MIVQRYGPEPATASAASAAVELACGMGSFAGQRESLIQISVGLVGFRLAGRMLHLPLLGAAGMHMQAVVTQLVDGLRAILRAAAVCGSIEELLDRPGVDLVVIATPNHLHAPQAIQALNTDKHVVIDKPFALSFRDADSLLESARSAVRTFLPCSTTVVGTAIS